MIGPDLVLIAVDDVGLWMRVEIKRQIGQRVGIEQVVGVQQDEIIADGGGGRLVRRGRDVADDGPVQGLDPGGAAVRQFRSLDHAAAGLQPSSTRTSSQSATVWLTTLRIIASKTSIGGL